MSLVAVDTLARPRVSQRNNSFWAIFTDVTGGICGTFLRDEGVMNRAEQEETKRLCLQG